MSSVSAQNSLQYSRCCRPRHADFPSSGRLQKVQLNMSLLHAGMLQRNRTPPVPSEMLPRLTMGDRSSNQITDTFLAGGCVERIVKIFRFVSVGIVENDPWNAVRAPPRTFDEDGRENPQG
jgi:hypothetical protein